MPKVAIVGNIASGKSVVESILKSRGYAVYDTDSMAHFVLDSSDDIKRTFHEVVVDNRIDRKKLAHIVFNSKEKLKMLEGFIHPTIKKQIELIEADDKIVFVAVPLLFEANMQNLFDKIIFVSAPVDLRVKRLMNRNSLTYQEAILRINSQDDEKAKIKNSDFVVVNNSTFENLEQQIDKILLKL
jgi:dephospho-CoA kinase